MRGHPVEPHGTGTARLSATCARASQERLLTRMVLIALPLLLVATLAAAIPEPAEAQSEATTGAIAPLRVFLDCQGQVPCDRNHFRTDIQWINWMNDRQGADVHLIVTSEQVGGGGRRYTLDFIGREAMGHLGDQLTYTSSGTDVQIETLDGITQAMRLGLVRFAVEAGMTTDFGVEFDPAVAVAASTGAADALAGDVQVATDPWNYWTFRAGLQGNMSVEELRESYRINPTFGADRVSEDWKVNFSTFVSFNRETITIPASATSPTRDVENNQDGWNTNATLVRSITPHFSTGMTVGGGSSTQNNRKARISVTPAIEWNYFPYMEANRRQLVAMYSAGVQYNSYEEETVFGVMQETVPLHGFEIQYRAVEGWGQAGVSFDASQYLHESGLYSASINGNVSIRVVRGLELNLNASYEKVEDQIHIQASDFSEEEILLGTVRLPTSFGYRASIGLSYRWGSSFSNIVNTRFPRSVR